MRKEVGELLVRTAGMFAAGGMGVYFWEVSVTVAGAMSGAFDLDWFEDRWETIVGMAVSTLVIWGVAAWRGWLWGVGIAVCAVAAAAFFIAAALRHEMGLSDNMMLRFHLYAIGITLIVSLAFAGVGFLAWELAHGVKAIRRGA